LLVSFKEYAMIRNWLTEFHPTAASEEDRTVRFWWLGLILGALSAWAWWFLRRREEAVEEEPDMEPVELPSVAPDLPDAGVRSAEEPLETVEVAEPDDLTRIEGVGPRVQEILNANEVRTYADLAATHPEHLRGWLREAGLAFIDPATWPQQAALAAVGNWEDLKALQADLTAGRRA
jgi:predicted flap endonuclease-1-like 5' DNA nuclease